MTRPACFTNDIQWEEWRRWALIAQVNPRPGDERPNFCQDCTACFKREMVAQGRCEYPMTRFTRVREPEAGKMPVGHEIIGYEGVKPTAGDYQLSRKAGASVSRPPAPRKPASPVAPPQPSQAQLGPSDLSEAALEAACTVLSGLLAAEQGKEPGPSQS